MAVGPVQPFIAAARSTGDLWAGSSLLSRVASELARTLAGETPDRLVFPAIDSLDELGDDFPVANRVLAVVDGDAGALASAAARRAQSWLRAEAARVFDTLPAGPAFARDVALAQVEQLLEVHWAAVPYPDGASWSEVRLRVDRLLACRKATRDFEQPVQVADSGRRRKSSIDGQREAVVEVGGDGTRGGRHPAWPRFGIRANEWLCGVSLLKRNLSLARFEGPSTTTGYAALPAVTRLQERHPDAYQAFVSTMEGVGADDRDSWLYEERLAECVAPVHLPSARAALRELRRATRVQPSAYYALLRADGDRMGKLIGDIEGLEEHRALSRRLVSFAREAREIVRRHRGHAIYTGGDDVLALLPVPGALGCARALAEEFTRKVAGQTLSAGLVVAHHLDPLHETLARSERAEGQAKLTRAALAVCVAKRSGSDLTVAVPWNEVEQALQWPGALFAADEIPGGLAYELGDAARRLAGAADQRTLEIAEARRILGRKQPGRGMKSGLDEGTRERLAERAASRGLGTLAAELSVARALAASEAGAQ